MIFILLNRQKQQWRDEFRSIRRKLAELPRDDQERELIRTRVPGVSWILGDSHYDEDDLSWREIKECREALETAKRAIRIERARVKQGLRVKKVEAFHHVFEKYCGSSSGWYFSERDTTVSFVNNGFNLEFSLDGDAGLLNCIFIMSTLAKGGNFLELQHKAKDVERGVLVAGQIQQWREKLLVEAGLDDDLQPIDDKEY